MKLGGKSVNAGRGDVRAEAIEEGKQLGLFLGKREVAQAQELKVEGLVSAAVDTTDLSRTCSNAFTKTSDLAPVILAIDTSSNPIDSMSTMLPSWADEADSLPAATNIPSATHDIAALHPEQLCASPFDSLHQHTHCSHFSHHRHGLRKHKNFLDSFSGTTHSSILPSTHTVLPPLSPY